MEAEQEKVEEGQKRKVWESAWHTVMVIQWIGWALMMTVAIPLMGFFIWLLFQLGYV